MIQNSITTNTTQSVEPPSAEYGVIGSTVVVNSMTPDSEYVNTQGVRFTTLPGTTVAG